MSAVCVYACMRRWQVEAADNRSAHRSRKRASPQAKTLRGLARDLKLSPSYLNDIEYDRRTPSDEVIRQLAELLDSNADALLAAAGKVGIGKDAEYSAASFTPVPAAASSFPA